MERSVVDKCIALIVPGQHETFCRRALERWINVLCWLNENEEYRREQHYVWMGITTPRKADREALLRLADALADAAEQLNETPCGSYLSLQLPTFDAAKFSKELETVVSLAREVAGSMHVKGGMPFNKFKLVTAFFAQTLMEVYGPKPPTLTIGGPYYELASVLYGAATGEHGADLSRQCKETSRRFPPARPLFAELKDE
jgi:hypothetical protein